MKYDFFSKLVKAQKQYSLLNVNCLCRSCSVTVLAAAVALAASAYAANGEFKVTTGHINSNAPQRIDKVTSFATKSLSVMSTSASLRYLSNQRLADSSLFASRLMSVMRNRTFRAAPFLPVPARDMSCYTDVPSYSKPLVFDIHKTPVTVEADEVKGDLNKKNNDLIYSGRVVIAQKDRSIDTDTAHYDSTNDIFSTSGNSVLKNGEYTVRTDETVSYGLKDKIARLKNTQFYFNGSVLRGSAQEHVVDNVENSQSIKSGTLTTCPTDDGTWHISASSVEIDRDEAFGEAWNAALWAGNVPVFYMPYINFPITSERRTGLLYPSFSIGSEHVKFTQPIYFNLAPNYDWTFTPSWLGEHRWQFLNEFRFMPWENVSGQLLFNYLPNDAEWTPAVSDDSRKRWYMHLTTRASFLNGDLLGFLNYQRVRPNDYSYLSDLAQPDAAITDDHLLQQLGASYIRPFYTLHTELRRYQSLLPSNRSSVYNRPFSMLPKLSGTAGNTVGKFQTGFYGELTRFELEGFGNYESEHSIRAHAEPYATYHVFDMRGTTLDVGVRGFLTHYDQGNLEKYGKSANGYFGFERLDDDVNRFLYELEVRGRTTFERKVLDMRHTQTVEPEIKYQYIPYKDQNSIALYDTTDHVDDYYSLYSFRRFAGIDRIADVNSLTAGVTSRLLDPHDREILRVGLAQTYSFEPTRVTLYSNDAHSTYPRSVLAGNVDARLFDRINMHSALAYDTQNSEFRSYNVSASYRTDSASVTANYRFIREGNYDLETGGARDLKQAGLGMTYALNRNYRLTAAIYRDLEQKFNINRKLALRREDCCSAVALFFEDYTKMDWNKREHTRDRVIGIQFELKNFYTIKIDGVDKPMSPDTHYMPFVDPTNLNR